MYVGIARTSVDAGGSSAITAAAPRRNTNGFVNIRS